MTSERSQVYVLVVTYRDRLAQIDAAMEANADLSIASIAFVQQVTVSSGDQVAGRRVSASGSWTQIIRDAAQRGWVLTSARCRPASTRPLLGARRTGDHRRGGAR